MKKNVKKKNVRNVINKAYQIIYVLNAIMKKDIIS